MMNVNNCCQNCGKEDSQLKICDHCKVVAYCSDACEIEDQLEHSKVCAVNALAIANPLDEQNTKFNKENNDGYDDDDHYYTYDSSTDDDNEAPIYLDDLFNPFNLLRFSLFDNILLDAFIRPYIAAYLANPFVHMNHPFLCLECNDLKFFHVFCPKCRRISYCSLMCLSRDCFHRLVCQPHEERSQCANCRRSDVALKKCTGCKKIEYCSKKCQRADWKQHKVLCKASKPKDGKSSCEESTEDRCARCTRSDVELTKCTDCNNVGYCSKVCQRADWEHHKTSCKTSKTENNEKSSSSSVKGQCSRCKKSDAVLKKCTRCNNVEYCSKVCQKLDWELHKASCKTSKTEEVKYSSKNSVKGECARCKKSDAVMKKCSACNNVEYCSKVCQRLDWTDHKSSCKTEDGASSSKNSIKGECRKCKRSYVELTKCSGCNNVEYCSKVCEIADWEDHRTSCQTSESKGQCANCSKSMRKCSGCHKVEYCSEDCQKAHWKYHKIACKASKTKPDDSFSKISVESQCARCKKSGEVLKKCSGCNNVGYCSKVCQRADWEHHKTSCKTSKTENNEKSSSSSVKGQCARCKKSDAVLKKCSSCKKVEYCSKVCQRADWKLHKASCKTSKTEEVKVERCDKCGKFNEHLMKCTKCKNAKYCSKSCQKSAWRLHKKSCQSAVDEIVDHNYLKAVRMAIWLFPSYEIATTFKNADENHVNQIENTVLLVYIVQEIENSDRKFYFISDIDSYVRKLSFHFKELDCSPYFSLDQLKPLNCVCILNPRFHPDYHLYVIYSAEQVRIF